MLKRAEENAKQGGAHHEMRGAMRKSEMGGELYLSFLTPMGSEKGGVVVTRKRFPSWPVWDRSVT